MTQHSVGAAPGGEVRSADVRRAAAPMVVFVDNGFAGFEQMACSLRRLGLRVAGVAYGHTDPQTRVRLHLTYGVVRFARSGKDLRTALAEWSGQGLVDVVCSEGLVQTVYEAAVAAGVPHQVVALLAWRMMWADKVAASRRLSEAGLPVPRSLVLPPDGGGMAAALAQIGLPAVVKSSFGAGGEGVRLVRDYTEAEAAIVALAGTGGSLFLEEFITGRNICYCASYDSADVHQEGVYVSERMDPTSTAPSRSVTTIAHPAAIAMGRAVLQVLGGKGLANIEMIDDPNRGLKLIDINPRPWGCIELMRAAGVAFDEGYLAALGCLSPPPAAVLPGDYSADVFPVATLDRIQQGGRAALRHFLSTVPTQIYTVGPRYTAANSLDIALRVARRTLKR